MDAPGDALDLDDFNDLEDEEEDDLDDEEDDEEDDPDDEEREFINELIAELDPNDPTLPPEIRIRLETLMMLRRTIARTDAAFARIDARKASREAYAARQPRPPTGERPRCGARCRDGHACVAPAVWLEGDPAPRNGRCRMHGGLSTGPRTAEGRARVAAATRAANVARREARQFVKVAVVV